MDRLSHLFAPIAHMDWPGNAGNKIKIPSSMVIKNPDTFASS